MIKEIKLLLLLMTWTLGALGQNCTFFADQDGDSFGDPNNPITIDCNTIVAGFVANDLDCDDTNFDINPNAIEICNGLDDNCNGGEIDEFVTNTYYQDSDGDGFGDPNFTIYDCNAPLGFVENMDDCDDAVVTYIDADGDGFGSDIIEPCGVTNNLDCNDNTTAIQDSTTYFADVDEDGYGNPNNSIVACNIPIGYVPDGSDCNDLDVDIHPGAIDIIGNGIDENCDGQDGVGIEEMNPISISLSPIPSSDFIQISGNMTRLSWSIYDAQGRCISQASECVMPIKMDIQDWAKGVYFLKTLKKTIPFVVN